MADNADDSSGKCQTTPQPPRGCILALPAEMIGEIAGHLTDKSDLRAFRATSTYIAGASKGEIIATVQRHTGLTPHQSERTDAAAFLSRVATLSTCFPPHALRRLTIVNTCHEPLTSRPVDGHLENVRLPALKELLLQGVCTTTVEPVMAVVRAHAGTLTHLTIRQHTILWAGESGKEIRPAAKADLLGPTRQAWLPVLKMLVGDELALVQLELCLGYLHVAHETGQRPRLPRFRLWGREMKMSEGPEPIRTFRHDMSYPVIEWRGQGAVKISLRNIIETMEKVLSRQEGESVEVGRYDLF